MNRALSNKKSYDFIQIYETSSIKRAYFKVRRQRMNEIASKKGFAYEIYSSVNILWLVKCFRLECFGFECLRLDSFGVEW